MPVIKLAVTRVEIRLLVSLAPVLEGLARDPLRAGLVIWASAHEGTSSRERTKIEVVVILDAFMERAWRY